MVQQADKTLRQYHHLTRIVKEHLHLINECGPRDFDPDSFVRFNNKIVISDCKPFLEAVKTDIGGELIDDPNIGLFLYYGEFIS